MITIKFINDKGETGVFISGNELYEVETRACDKEEIAPTPENAKPKLDGDDRYEIWEAAMMMYELSGGAETFEAYVKEATKARRVLIENC